MLKAAPTTAKVYLHVQLMLQDKKYADNYAAVLIMLITVYSLSSLSMFFPSGNAEGQKNDEVEDAEDAEEGYVGPLWGTNLRATRRMTATTTLTVQAAMMTWRRIRKTSTCPLAHNQVLRVHTHTHTALFQIAS